MTKTNAENQRESKLTAHHSSCVGTSSTVRVYNRFHIQHTSLQGHCSNKDHKSYISRSTAPYCLYTFPSTKPVLYCSYNHSQNTLSLSLHHNQSLYTISGVFSFVEAPLLASGSINSVDPISSIRSPLSTLCGD